MAYINQNEIIIKFTNQDGLFEQIERIKALENAGISHDLFFQILWNAHNGMSEFENNNFALTEWEQHFISNNIVVNQNQIELFFEYFRYYYKTFVCKNQTKYSFSSRDLNSYIFGLETIVLKSLE